jgi:hypothetical protein
VKVPLAQGRTTCPPPSFGALLFGGMIIRIGLITISVSALNPASGSVGVRSALCRHLATGRHQGRRVRLSGIAQEHVHRPGIQPQIAQSA